MTEEQASNRAVELIREIYSVPISEYNTDERVISMYDTEYTWFMKGWKETMESLKPVPKRCPKCNSESVIMFDSDNDICNECGNLC